MSEQPDGISVPGPSAAVPEPALLPREAEPSGIGGLLVLVALGVFLSPLLNAAIVVGTYPPLFMSGRWEILTTPDSPAYHALWAPLLIGEVVCNVSFIATGVWLIVLFLRRSRRFPNVYMGYLVASAMFVFADDQLLSVVLKGSPALASDHTGVGRAVISAAIWVPYMLSSRRVRNTFVS